MMSLVIERLIQYNFHERHYSDSEISKGGHCHRQRTRGKSLFRRTPEYRLSILRSDAGFKTYYPCGMTVLGKEIRPVKTSTNN